MSDPPLNDYDIDFEMRPDYLLVRVVLARNEYNIARQYWTDVLRMVHRRRSPRVIVQISANAALPPIDAQALMTEFSRFLYPGIRVAIVNRHVNEDVRTAVQSGATIRDRSIQVFDDIATAERWMSTDDMTYAPATLDSDVQDLTGRDRVQ